MLKNDKTLGVYMRKLIIPFFLFFALCLSAKQPELTFDETLKKTQEIMKQHVKYKELTPQIVERILQNFLEELDPGKVYFIESDIQHYWYPADALVQRTLKQMQHANYKTFTEMYTLMLKAIERRRTIDPAVAAADKPKGVKPEEFKDIKWAVSKQELTERLIRIKGLQMEAASKFEDENMEQFQKRIDKRQIKRENELKGMSEKDRQIQLQIYLLKAICSALDSHTDYFTPMEADQFMIQVQQRLFGIGAQLKDNLNGFAITRILEGGPAEKSKKLKINDRIVAVNKEPVVGLNIEEAVELIRGKKGSPVNLTILRDTEDKKTIKFDIEIIRGEVVLEESRLDTTFEPYGDGIIPCIKLFSFYQDPNTSSAKDIKNAFAHLKKEHKIKGVVLDLRSNAGGLLPQAVAVAGLFLQKGIVVSIQDSTGNVQHLRNTDSDMMWDGPLIVLINKASASASEIVAQSLQDYGRALLVGDETTFGKGTFQTFTLDATSVDRINPQGEYKVTRGMYYTVSGKSPQLVGAKADIVVPGILSELEIGEKFSKYPLENAHIDPHFKDDLSDIPFIHRQKVALLYQHHMQPILTEYTQYVDQLKKNSQKRIEKNKNYQNFLTEIHKKNYDSETVEIFGQNDLQLTEAYNILKDLVFLEEIKEKQAVGY
jgi:carboxyl-terminal processing protease